MLTPSTTSGGRVEPLCRGSGANCNGDCSGSGTNRQRADAGFPFDPQVDKMLIMQRSASSLIRALYYVTNCHGLTVMVCRRLGTPRRFGRGRALPQRAHHREPGGRGGYAAFLAGPYPPRRRQPPPRGRDPCRGHRSFAARRPRRSASALQHRRRRRARPHAQASEKTREAVLTVCEQCGSGALRGAWPAVRACSRRARSTSAWSPRSPRSSTRTSADPGPRLRLLAGAGQHCPPGAYEPAVCAAGAFSHGGRASACRRCTAGTFSTAAAGGSPRVAACLRCAAGTYGSTARASSATVCAACAGGKYAPALGSGAPGPAAAASALPARCSRSCIRRTTTARRAGCQRPSPARPDGPSAAPRGNRAAPTGLSEQLQVGQGAAGSDSR